MVDFLDVVNAETTGLVDFVDVVIAKSTTGTLGVDVESPKSTVRTTRADATSAKSSAQTLRADATSAKSSAEPLGALGSEAALQVGGGLEDHGLLGGDRDLFVGARGATDAGRALFEGEGSKPRVGEALLTFHGLADVQEDLVDELAERLLRQILAAPLLEPLDELGLGHARAEASGSRPRAQPTFAPDIKALDRDIPRSHRCRF